MGIYKYLKRRQPSTHSAGTLWLTVLTTGVVTMDLLTCPFVANLADIHQI